MTRPISPHVPPSPPHVSYGFSLLFESLFGPRNAVAPPRLLPPIPLVTSPCVVLRIEVRSQWFVPHDNVEPNSLRWPSGNIARRGLRSSLAGVAGRACNSPIHPNVVAAAHSSFLSMIFPFVGAARLWAPRRLAPCPPPPDLLVGTRPWVKRQIPPTKNTLHRHFIRRLRPTCLRLPTLSLQFSVPPL